MRRRHFVVVAGLAAIAGCAGSDDEDPDTGNTSAETEQNQEKSNEQEQETDDGQVDEEEPDDEQEGDEGEPEYVVTGIKPDSAALGEYINIEFTVENQGDGAGSSQLEVYSAATAGRTPEFDDWEESSIMIDIDAGEQETYIFADYRTDRPTVLFYRVRQREVDHRINIPESRAPILTDASLVSGWETFGDLDENRIEQAEVGESIEIGFEYWYWEDQRLDVFRTVRLFDENGERVRIENDSGEQLVENVGWRQYQATEVFDTTGLDPGEYTAEILIQDENSGETSEPIKTTFRLDPPPKPTPPAGRACRRDH